MNSFTPPFSQSFVIKVTIQHMKDAIDHSIRKTIARMEEFRTDPERMHEALHTLDSLNRLHELLDNVLKNNTDILEA